MNPGGHGGLALIGFAGAYALAASNLSMTSSLGIGAGLFPMALAGILAVLGLVVAIQGYAGAFARRNSEDEGMRAAAPPVPLRGVLLVAGAPVLFALLVVPLGVVPALALAVFVSALAHRSMSLLGAIGVSAAMVLFCTALFRWGLGLPLDLFGPMLEF